MVKKGMFIGERYEIIDKVGSGGMSDVYKAKDHKLGRFVAVKVLKQEFSEDKNFVSKFKIEAQSAAGLAHPNIVNIFDVGEDNGLYYIVMELVDGITLKTYISRKGQLPVKEAVSIAVQVAQGIEAAHNNHIIHRDIKPQNIIISKEGKVKVTDFGIARAASSNTINSNAMGSVHYISPEQARNGYVDEKSDIYSLGISLYEMITGRVPFEGDSTVTIALQHVQDDIPPMKNFVENIPISVEKIVEKCTQKKPDRRYLKVSTLIADLKKSLVTPDEDFVQLIPAGANASMVMISENEVNVIKQDTGIDELIKDIEEDKDEGIAAIPVRNLKDIDVSEDEYDDDEDDYDEFDGRSQRLDKIVTIGSIVFAVIIIIAAVILFSKIFDGCSVGSSLIKPTTTITGNDGPAESTTPPVTNSKQTIVPSVVGRTEADAISLIDDAELEYEIVEYRADNNLEKGRVIEQSVDAGKVVDKFATIKLVISDGPSDVKVPDVVDKKKDAAVKTLEDAGFKVKTIFDKDDEIVAGNVISTDPEADKTVKYGSTITITVSQGKDTKVTVPDLKGKTVEEAEEELTELGLTINVLSEEFSTKYEAGKIMVQDIRPDTEIDTAVSGNVINVTVSKGEEVTTEKVVESTAKFYSDSLGVSLPTLTDEEAATAIITAKISYTDAKGATQTEDISSYLTGYNGTDGVNYTADWAQAADIEVTVNADAGTRVKLTVTLSYLSGGETVTKNYTSSSNSYN